MPGQAWIDFLQQHQTAHLVSAVLMPPRTAAHARRLRSMLSQLIEQQGPEFGFATAIVRKRHVVEIHCGFAHKADADLFARLMQARTAPGSRGWSSHRSFRLSADTEVTMAGLLAPKDGGNAPLPPR